MPSLNFAPRVPVFDANIRVGDTPGAISPSPTRESLLAEMDRHGVERAIIYHAQSELRSPTEGNRRLEEWLGDDGRLLPQWTIMPTADSMRQIEDLHAAGRVQSVRLYDVRHAELPFPPARLPFRPWAFGDLLDWLSVQGIPLWISLPDADPDELVTTLQAYPDIVTVLVGAHYAHTLLVRPILRALPNAYLELSRYEPIGELEALRDEFGANRLVYGSWYSRFSMGPMLFYLHETTFSDAELRLVCAGNLERILRGEGRHD
jgi:uncharacterized protein